jgi:hypothetical protein
LLRENQVALMALGWSEFQQVFPSDPEETSFYEIFLAYLELF